MNNSLSSNAGSITAETPLASAPEPRVIIEEPLSKGTPPALSPAPGSPEWVTPPGKSDPPIVTSVPEPRVILEEPLSKGTPPALSPTPESLDWPWTGKPDPFTASNEPTYVPSGGSWENNFSSTVSSLIPLTNENDITAMAAVADDPLRRGDILVGNNVGRPPITTRVVNAGRQGDYELRLVDSRGDILVNIPLQNLGGFAFPTTTTGFGNTVVWIYDGTRARQVVQIDVHWNTEDRSVRRVIFYVRGPNGNLIGFVVWGDAIEGMPALAQAGEVPIDGLTATGISDLVQPQPQLVMMAAANANEVPAAQAVADAQQPGNPPLANFTEPPGFTKPYTRQGALNMGVGGYNYYDSNNPRRLVAELSYAGPMGDPNNGGLQEIQVSNPNGTAAWVCRYTRVFDPNNPNAPPVTYWSYMLYNNGILVSTSQSEGPPNIDWLTGAGGGNAGLPNAINTASLVTAQQNVFFAANMAPEVQAVAPALAMFNAPANPQPVTAGPETLIVEQNPDGSFVVTNSQGQPVTHPVNIYENSDGSFSAEYEYNVELNPDGSYTVTFADGTPVPWPVNVTVDENGNYHVTPAIPLASAPEPRVIIEEPPYKGTPPALSPTPESLDWPWTGKPDPFTASNEPAYVPSGGSWENNNPPAGSTPLTALTAPVQVAALDSSNIVIAQAAQNPQAQPPVNPGYTEPPGFTRPYTRQGGLNMGTGSYNYYDSNNPRKLVAELSYSSQRGDPNNGGLSHIQVSNPNGTLAWQSTYIQVFDPNNPNAPPQTYWANFLYNNGILVSTSESSGPPNFDWLTGAGGGGTAQSAGNGGGNAAAPIQNLPNVASIDSVSSKIANTETISSEAEISSFIAQVQPGNQPPVSSMSTLGETNANIQTASSTDAIQSTSISNFEEAQNAATVSIVQPNGRNNNPPVPAPAAPAPPLAVGTPGINPGFPPGLTYNNAFVEKIEVVNGPNGALLVKFYDKTGALLGDNSGAVNITIDITDANGQTTTLNIVHVEVQRQQVRNPDGTIVQEGYLIGFFTAADMAQAGINRNPSFTFYLPAGIPAARPPVAAPQAAPPNVPAPQAAPPNVPAPAPPVKPGGDIIAGSGSTPSVISLTASAITAGTTLADTSAAPASVTWTTDNPDSSTILSPDARNNQGTGTVTLFAQAPAPASAPTAPAPATAPAPLDAPETRRIGFGAYYAGMFERTDPVVDLMSDFSSNNLSGLLNFLKKSLITAYPTDLGYEDVASSTIEITDLSGNVVTSISFNPGTTAVPPDGEISTQITFQYRVKVTGIKQRWPGNIVVPITLEGPSNGGPNAEIRASVARSYNQPTVPGTPGTNPTTPPVGTMMPVSVIADVPPPPQGFFASRKLINGNASSSSPFTLVEKVQIFQVQGNSTSYNAAMFTNAQGQLVFGVIIDGNDKGKWVGPDGLILGSMLGYGSTGQVIVNWTPGGAKVLTASVSGSTIYFYVDNTYWITVSLPAIPLNSGGGLGTIGSSIVEQMVAAMAAAAATIAGFNNPPASAPVPLVEPPPQMAQLPGSATNGTPQVVTLLGLPDTGSSVVNNLNVTAPSVTAPATSSPVTADNTPQSVNTTFALMASDVTESQVPQLTAFAALIPANPEPPPFNPAPQNIQSVNIRVDSGPEYMNWDLVDGYIASGPAIGTEVVLRTDTGLALIQVNFDWPLPLNQAGNTSTPLTYTFNLNAQGNIAGSASDEGSARLTISMNNGALQARFEFFNKAGDLITTYRLSQINAAPAGRRAGGNANEAPDGQGLLGPSPGIGGLTPPAGGGDAGVTESLNMTGGSAVSSNLTQTTANTGSVVMAFATSLLPTPNPNVPVLPDMTSEQLWDILMTRYNAIRARIPVAAAAGGFLVNQATRSLIATIDTLLGSMKAYQQVFVEPLTAEIAKYDQIIAALGQNPGSLTPAYTLLQGTALLLQELNDKLDKGPSYWAGIKPLVQIALGLVQAAAGTGDPNQMISLLTQIRGALVDILNAAKQNQPSFNQVSDLLDQLEAMLTAQGIPPVPVVPDPGGIGAVAGNLPQSGGTIAAFSNPMAATIVATASSASAAPAISANTSTGTATAANPASAMLFDVLTPQERDDVNAVIDALVPNNGQFPPGQNSITYFLEDFPGLAMTLGGVDVYAVKITPVYNAQGQLTGCQVVFLDESKNPLYTATSMLVNVNPGRLPAPAPAPAANPAPVMLNGQVNVSVPAIIESNIDELIQQRMIPRDPPPMPSDAELIQQRMIERPDLLPPFQNMIERPNPLPPLQNMIERPNPLPPLQNMIERPDLLPPLQNMIERPDPLPPFQNMIERPNPLPPLQNMIERPNPLPPLQNMIERPDPLPPLQNMIERQPVQMAQAPDAAPAPAPAPIHPVIQDLIDKLTNVQNLAGLPREIVGDLQGVIDALKNPNPDWQKILGDLEWILATRQMNGAAQSVIDGVRKWVAQKVQEINRAVAQEQALIQGIIDNYVRLNRRLEMDFRRANIEEIAYQLPEADQIVIDGKTIEAIKISHIRDANGNIIGYRVKFLTGEKELIRTVDFFRGFPAPAPAPDPDPPAVVAIAPAPPADRPLRLPGVYGAAMGQPGSWVTDVMNRGWTIPFSGELVRQIEIHRIAFIQGGDVTLEVLAHYRTANGQDQTYLLGTVTVHSNNRFAIRNQQWLDDGAVNKVELYGIAVNPDTAGLLPQLTSFNPNNIVGAPPAGGGITVAVSPQVLMPAANIVEVATVGDIATGAVLLQQPDIASNAFVASTVETREPAASSDQNVNETVIVIDPSELIASGDLAFASAFRAGSPAASAAFGSAAAGNTANTGRSNGSRYEDLSSNEREILFDMFPDLRARIRELIVVLYSHDWPTAVYGTLKDAIMNRLEQVALFIIMGRTRRGTFTTGSATDQERNAATNLAFNIFDYLFGQLHGDMVARGIGLSLTDPGQNMPQPPVTPLGSMDTTAETRESAISSNQNINETTDNVTTIVIDSSELIASGVAASAPASNLVAEAAPVAQTGLPAAPQAAPATTSTPVDRDVKNGQLAVWRSQDICGPMGQCTPPAGHLSYMNIGAFQEGDSMLLINANRSLLEKMAGFMYSYWRYGPTDINAITPIPLTGAWSDSSGVTHVTYNGPDGIPYSFQVYRNKDQTSMNPVDYTVRTLTDGAGGEEKTWLMTDYDSRSSSNPATQAIYDKIRKRQFALAVMYIENNPISGLTIDWQSNQMTYTADGKKLTRKFEISGSQIKIALHPPPVYDGGTYYKSSVEKDAAGNWRFWGKDTAGNSVWYVADIQNPNNVPLFSSMMVEGAYYRCIRNCPDSPAPPSPMARLVIRSATEMIIMTSSGGPGAGNNSSPDKNTSTEPPAVVPPLPREILTQELATSSDQNVNETVIIIDPRELIASGDLAFASALNSEASFSDTARAEQQISAAASNQNTRAFPGDGPIPNGKVVWGSMSWSWRVGDKAYSLKVYMPIVLWWALQPNGSMSEYGIQLALAKYSENTAAPPPPSAFRVDSIEKDKTSKDPNAYIVKYNNKSKHPLKINDNPYRGTDSGGYLPWSYNVVNRVTNVPANDLMGPRTRVTSVLEAPIGSDPAEYEEALKSHIAYLHGMDWLARKSIKILKYPSRGQSGDLVYTVDPYSLPITRSLGPSARSTNDRSQNNYVDIGLIKRASNNVSNNGITSLGPLPRQGTGTTPANYFSYGSSDGSVSFMSTEGKSNRKLNRQKRAMRHQQRRLKRQS